jgi:hypothetical protein
MSLRASISLTQHTEIDQRLHANAWLCCRIAHCDHSLNHSLWHGARWEATTAECGVCSPVKLNTIHVYSFGKSQFIYMAATALGQSFSIATAWPSLSEVKQIAVQHG